MTPNPFESLEVCILNQLRHEGEPTGLLARVVRADHPGGGAQRRRAPGVPEAMQLRPLQGNRP